MLISWSAAASLVEGALARNGFTPEEIRPCTEELLDAEWRGKTSFGLLIVPELVKLRAKKKGEPRIEREDAVSAFIEGGDAPGPFVAAYALDVALEKVRASGVAVVGARNRWPWLTAGYPVRRAAEQGYVAATWSAGISIVAPHGAVRRVFGTNPFAIAVPAAGGPLVFDSATTASAASAVRDARRRGELLPEGAAIDSDGRPTRDPDAVRAGAMLPFAGHRGSGLGLMIELLGGAWIGAKTGTRHGAQRGFVYWLASRDLFGFGERFPSVAEGLVEEVRAAAAGADQVHIPGRRPFSPTEPRDIDPEILAAVERLAEEAPATRGAALRR